MENMKTFDLIGIALNWAVSQAEDLDYEWDNFGVFEEKTERYNDLEYAVSYEPSTNWTQGGPIIERERITLINNEPTTTWIASVPGTEFTKCRVLEYGHTPLIAAMRCFVASKLGDEIDIPENLK